MASSSFTAMVFEAGGSRLLVALEGGSFELIEHFRSHVRQFFGAVSWLRRPSLPWCFEAGGSRVLAAWKVEVLSLLSLFLA